VNQFNVKCLDDAGIEALVCTCKVHLRLHLDTLHTYI